MWKGDLRHQDISGVTTGVWSYRCSESLPAPNRSINCNLDLVLKPTHGGRALSKVPEEILESREFLSGTKLVDPGVVAPWVKAQSVFTKDGEHVIRRLQVDELLDIYDAEVITQHELGNCWRSSHCALSCAFAFAAPLKVLVEVGRLFYSKLRDDGWPTGLPPVNESALSPKRGCNESKASDGTGGAGAAERSKVANASKRPRINPHDDPLPRSSFTSDREEASV